MTSFFDGIAQEEVTFGQFRGKAPMFFREVRMMSGVFTANLGAARRLLPTTRHHALRVLPGRAVVAVHCFEYVDTDIGAYNEVSLSIAVSHGEQPKLGLARLLAAARTDNYHAFVVQLPVTTDAAVAGGVEVLGFPKYLAEIAFEETPTHRICIVRDPGTKEPIVRMEGERIPTRPCDQRVEMNSYPIRKGETLHARMSLHQLEGGSSLVHRRMIIEPGRHVRAQVFHDLRLGRQLQYTYAPLCEAILFRPEAAE